MKLRASGLLLLGFFASSLTQAAEFPVCYKMTNDSLNRFYVVARDTDDPFAGVASLSSRPVKVYEYVNSPLSQPYARVYLNDHHSGMALMSGNDIDYLKFGSVNGADVGSMSITQTTIMHQGMPGENNWLIRRWTSVGSPTEHSGLQVSCVDPFN